MLGAVSTEPDRHRDPRRPAARRRTLRLWALQGAPGAGRCAGRRRRHRARHVAPPAAGEEPRRLGPRRADRRCSGCPTAGRSCSATAARPCSGTSPRSVSIARPQPAPRVRRVLVEVRRGGRRGAPPRRADRRQVRHRHPSRRPIAEDGIDLYALTHNETSTGVAMQLRRPAGTSADDGARRRRRHVGSRWPAVGSRPRSTSTTSPRRSASPPTAACGSPPAPPRRSSASSRSGRATGGGRRRSTCRSPSTTAAPNQTYNTPALATLVMLDAQVRWMLDNGGMDVRRRAQRRVGVDCCTGGPRRAPRPRRSSPTRRSARTSSAPSTSTTPSTPTAVNAALRANGIARHRLATASSAATSCASACSRRSTRPTSTRSPAASTTSSEPWPDMTAERPM